ncbi:PREDICTED: uncharacterized protein LOC101374364 [Odobenus rosmarus divergens]|uniref:Uncharacterized protein LOC101374364 n=1 Tax=Odobenus rosmarus divergens TaxID=9708 RepID=A0A9B0G874_ODORO
MVQARGRQPCWRSRFMEGRQGEAGRRTLSSRSSPPRRLPSSSFRPPAPQTRDCISRQAPRPAANEGLRIWRRRRRRSESRVGGLCARRRRRERAAAAAAARTEVEAEGDCPLVVAERRAKANSSPRGPCCPGPAASHSLLSSSRGRAATPHLSTAPAHPTSRSLPLSFTPGPARPRPSSVPAAMAEASGAREI